MSLAVRIEAGRMVCEIPDRKGRKREYEVTPTTGQRLGALWSADVVEVGELRRYRVVLWPGGQWGCDCPWRRWRSPVCKHEAGACEIAAVMGVEVARKQSEERMAKAKAEQMTPAEKIRKALRNPLHPSEVKFKPAQVKGNRCMALAYIDARAVMDRLDDAVGIDGWRDSYSVQPDGSVLCRLEIRIGGEWISREDVGGESEQPDKHDKAKAAHSDALKRAAVKFGIGRYLYHLPRVWVDYDPKRRQIIRPPVLPAWALPDAVEEPPPPVEDEEPEAAPVTAPATQIAAQQAQPQQQQQAVAKTEKVVTIYDRALAFEAKLIEARLCEQGDLIRRLVEKFGNGHGAKPQFWSGEQLLEKVRAECLSYEKEAKAKKQPSNGAAA